MIVFALSVLFCVSATDCRWWPEGHWLSEQRCKEMGALYQVSDPQVMRYKCVATVHENGFALGPFKE